MAPERSDSNPAPKEQQSEKRSSRKGFLRRVADFFDSATKILLAVGGLVAAVTALWAGIVHFVSSGHEGIGGTPSAAVRFVVQPESCGALSFGADGNAGPVTCPDGRPNLAAVNYFSQLRLKVLRLGPNANPNDVELAICQDIDTRDTTFPIEASAVSLATALQDWHFGINIGQEIPDLAAN